MLLGIDVVFVVHADVARLLLLLKLQFKTMEVQYMYVVVSLFTAAQRLVLGWCRSFRHRLIFGYGKLVISVTMTLVWKVCNLRPLMDLELKVCSKNFTTHHNGNKGF